jgi:hypothetical protein
MANGRDYGMDRDFSTFMAQSQATVDGLVVDSKRKIDQTVSGVQDRTIQAEREMSQIIADTRERLEKTQDRLVRWLTIAGTVVGTLVLGGIILVASWSIEESRTKVADRVMDLQKDIIQAQGVIGTSTKDMTEALAKLHDLENQLTASGKKLEDSGKKLEDSLTALKGTNTKLSEAESNFDAEKGKLDGLVQQANDVIGRLKQPTSP